MRRKWQQSPENLDAETEEAGKETEAEIRTRQETNRTPNLKVRVKVKGVDPATQMGLQMEPARSTGNLGSQPGCVQTVTTVRGGTTRAPAHVTIEILQQQKKKRIVIDNLTSPEMLLTHSTVMRK